MTKCYKKTLNPTLAVKPSELIGLPTSWLAVVVVYDLNGRKQIEKHIPVGSESIKIDAISLSNGMYCCWLIINEESKTQKLIIQK